MVGLAVVKRLRPLEAVTVAIGGLHPILDGDDADLLSRLRTGATYAEIAESLGYSVETVKVVRVARLYRRLGAANRTEAIARADAQLLRENLVLRTKALEQAGFSHGDRAVLLRWRNRPFDGL